MTNEEHLELAKKQDEDFIKQSKKERDFFKEHGYGIYDYPSKTKEKKLELMSAEYRKIKALEIIAENFILLNQNLVTINQNAEGINEKLDGHFCVRIE